MKKEHQAIIECLSKFLEEKPDQRFGQALFNLNINEFLKETDLMNPKHQLRDIYNDSDDDILTRVKTQFAHFSNNKSS